MKSTEVQHDIRDANDIKRLVDTFYEHVQADELLGHIFNEVVGIHWDEHLPQMYRFWTTVLFSEPAYKGNPRLVHGKVDELLKSHRGIGIRREDFDRWLEIFHSTIDDLFAGDTADRAKYASTQIANNLSIVLGVSSGETI